MLSIILLFPFLVISSNSFYSFSKCEENHYLDKNTGEDCVTCFWSSSSHVIRNSGLSYITVNVESGVSYIDALEGKKSKYTIYSGEYMNVTKYDDFNIYEGQMLSDDCEISCVGCNCTCRVGTWETWGDYIIQPEPPAPPPCPKKEDPINPEHSLYVFIGAIIGVMIGMAFAYLIYYYRKKNVSSSESYNALSDTTITTRAQLV